MDVTSQLLKERICDVSDRIPTSRWPYFSTTIKGEIAVGLTTGTLTFEAERDTLLTDLSAVAQDDANADLAASIDIEYCNITYAEHSNVLLWAFCCSRKPIFLVGVKENKKLRFNFTLAAVAPAGNANISVTLSGLQGDGCCN